MAIKTFSELETKLAEIIKRLQKVERMLKELINKWENEAEQEEETEEMTQGSEIDIIDESEEIELGCELYECPNCGSKHNGEHDCEGEIEKDDIDIEDTIYCYPCHFGEGDCSHCNERKPERRQFEPSAGFCLNCEIEDCDCGREKE